MRYIPTDKYTVAWFKLAECVAKGEKEKAFGVYRLLMHSLEDKAYAQQLEGDLLGAFQDERALEKYEHAAQLYMANNRWKEAIALYEELAIMNFDNLRAVNSLLQLYITYKKPEQYMSRLIHLAHLLYDKKWFSHFEKLIDAFAECNMPDDILKSQMSLVLQVIKNKDLESHLIEKLISKMALCAFLGAQNTLFTTFLHELEHTDSHWHQYAQRCIISYGLK